MARSLGERLPLIGNLSLSHVSKGTTAWPTRDFLPAHFSIQRENSWQRCSNQSKRS